MHSLIQKAPVNSLEQARLNRNTYLPLLLYVKERDAIHVSQQKCSGAGVKYFIARGSVHFLRHFVLHVLNNQLRMKNKFREQ